MYRNVLIATDGSELAQKAVDHGVAMAQAINAKVTVVTVSEPFHAFTVSEPFHALTVSEPFHAFAVQPRMVTDAREQYQQHVAACAAECFAAAKKAAFGCGCHLRHGARRKPASLSGHYRYGDAERL